MKLFKIAKKIESALAKHTENVVQHEFLIDNRWQKDKKDIYLSKGAIQALKEAKKDLPTGYNFIILNGLRSLKDQLKIVKEMEKELKKTNPNDWEDLLNKYTGGYKELELKQDEISYMSHRSGNAVDITLALNGKEVDMGLGADGKATKDKQDKIDYYETKNNLNNKEKTIKKNRRILKKALTTNGFKNYKDEWWHWGIDVSKIIGESGDM